MWLAFRHRTCRRPRDDGWATQGRWDVFATAYLGDRWLAPVELPQSAGRNDMRVDSAARPRRQRLLRLRQRQPRLAPAGHAAAEPAASHVSRLQRRRQAGRVRSWTTPKPSLPKTAIVHPEEAEQVARIRDYKIEHGGKTYRIYRGDLHRHTDISSDGIGDGSLMDLHRYGLDAAAMDFILVGDHNMGDDNEYCWWRTQKANDLYTVPGSFHLDVRLRAQRAVSATAIAT